MRVTILDGYVDEPSCLGVPPYISPYPRAVAGAAVSGGAEVEYVSMDQLRSLGGMPSSDLLVVIGGHTVPGRYLRGQPGSKRELMAAADRFPSTKLLGGPMAAHYPSDDLRKSFDLIVKNDIEASVHEFVRSGRLVDRRRSLEEFDEWSALGAEICRQHPDFGGPLIAELQTYRGCIRYFTGGCSFCVEPLFGEVEFRSPDGIIAEAEALAKVGVRRLRLGGQSCFISYMAEGVGASETPRPSPGIVEHLLRGIRDLADPIVLHLDNANPAVIAEHPEESERIMESIVKHCTSGNVLALGLESADPAVRELNNLNATPEQLMTAVELINRVGSAQGPSGLPLLLPGINLLFGLRGETIAAFKHDADLLLEIKRRGLMLRRINIRQALPMREGFIPGKRKLRHAFIKFKSWVRENIDRPMLEKVVPADTIMTDVYLEAREGNNTFGRQVGSYPLLVGLPYRCETGRFVDVKIVSHGFRSVTGTEYPLDINRAPLAALSSIPSIGEKRARRIALARPIRSPLELEKALDSREAVEEVLRFAGLR